MSESMRRRLERAEDTRLAPFALRSAGAERFYPIEDEGRVFDYRTGFQRDRDRIVYSRAFRRLRQKAQAGILPAYEDHRRNRLTHTLEVAQVARTIGRALALNEDLIEAVALAHDLGQAPFGPTGERALDDLMAGRLDGHGGPGCGDLGGFWRGWQGLRVVDRLEKRYDHPGLNLTNAVREGILKTDPRDRVPAEPVEGVRRELAAGLEVQTVRLADDIASALHDLDDALQSGALDVGQVERLKAVEALRRKLGSKHWPKASRFMKANAIHRGLTHLLVTGAILNTDAALRRWSTRHGISAYGTFLERRDDVLQDGLVSLPRRARDLLDDLEGFLAARTHRGHEADQVEARGRRAVLGLFAAYFADPSLLADHVLLRYKEISGVRFLRDVPRPALEKEFARSYRGDPRFVRLLADYLGGMTDSFATTEHARLLAMGAVPIPSAEQLRREEGG
jgi:dGTPase